MPMKKDLIKVTCSDCNKVYTVDLRVPDDVWEVIEPPARPGKARDLCGACILARIELVLPATTFELRKL